MAEADVRALAEARGVALWPLRRELARLGFVLCDGRWHQPAPGGRYWMTPESTAAVRALDIAEAQSRLPAPLMRPLLEDLAGRIATDSATAAVDRVLADPAPGRLPSGRRRAPQHERSGSGYERSTRAHGSRFVAVTIAGPS